MAQKEIQVEREESWILDMNTHQSLKEKWKHTKTSSFRKYKFAE